MGRKTAKFRATSLICACLLSVPAAGQAQSSSGSVACGSPHVIGKGESLGSVAQKAYGDPKRSDILFQANRQVIGDNPSNVPVGLSIMVPCLDANGNPVVNAAMAAAISAEGPLEPAELDTLFGPVALFPDTLLSEVMMATTYPTDIVEADKFVKASASLSDKDRALAAEQQPWDPSVVQLAAAFPDLVTRMADHIDWTEQAGEAVIAQTDDVLASIQRLRTKAQDNGYLTANDAQTVQVVDNHIYIAPADPQVIYVPTYDSNVIYTTPISAAPGYNPYYYGYQGNDWGNALATGAIIFGTAMVLDNIFDNNDHWGGSWHNNDRINWNTGDINVDRSRNVDIGGDVNIGNRNTKIGGGNANIGGGNTNIGNGNTKIGGGNTNIGSGNTKIGGGNTNIGNGNTKIGGDNTNIGSGNSKIGSGNTNIGSGNSKIGSGNFGDGQTRPSAIPDRIGGSESDALAGRRDGTFAPDAASRDVARGKIETRKAVSPGVATLPASRPSANTPKPNAAAVQAAKDRPAAAQLPSAAQRPANVSKPKTVQRPSASVKPPNATAFDRSGGARAAAGSSRGKASAGARRR